MINLYFFLSLATCWFRRSGPRQPARRRLHQRPAAAQPRPAEDHRDGGRRRPAVRHLAAAARQPRLRLEDPQQIPGSTSGILCDEHFYKLLEPGLVFLVERTISKNFQPIGDWIDPTRSDRGFKASRCNTGSGSQDRGVQEREPGHLLLGDPGEAHQGISFFCHPGVHTIDRKVLIQDSTDIALL